MIKAIDGFAGVSDADVLSRFYLHLSQETLEEGTDSATKRHKTSQMLSFLLSLLCLFVANSLLRKADLAELRSKPGSQFRTHIHHSRKLAFQFHVVRNTCVDQHPVVEITRQV